MNYPLGAAILGFAGGGQLDRAVIDRHDTYRRTMHPLDGIAFAKRLDHLMTVYDPAVTAVQLNLLGSHDAPRALTVLGRDRAAFRVAMLLQLTLPGAPSIYYGDEIGMEGAGDTDLRAFVRTVLGARHERRALRRGTVRTLAATQNAVALLREADGERAIVVVNAGRSVETIAFELPKPAWRGLRALDLPGWLAPALDGSGSVGSSVPERLSFGLPPQVGLVLVDEVSWPR
jgi:glycosidase